MLWRGNEGENRPDAETSSVKPNTTQQKSVSRETMSREELLASDPKAREMYERLRELRKSVDAISATQNQDKPAKNITSSSSTATKSTVEAERIKAAEAAVKRNAKEEALRIKRQAEAARAKELQHKIQVEEARRRAAQRQYEAEQKRQAAIRAEKAAKEVARKKSIESIDVAKNAALITRQQELAMRASEAVEQRLNAEVKAAEEKNQQALHAETMDALRDELLSAQQRQDAILGKISDIADRSTMKLTETQVAQIQELTEAQQQARYIRAEQRRQLKAELEQNRAERARMEQIHRAELRAAELKAQRERAEAEVARQRALEEQARILKEQDEAKRKQAEAVAAAKTAKAQYEAEQRRLKAEREAEAKRLKAEREAEIKRAKAVAAAKAKAEKQAKELAIKQAKAEKHARELAAKQAKAAEEARIKEERKQKARQLWQEREDKRQKSRREKLDAKLRAQAEKLRLQEEKARIKLQRKKELDEIERLKLISEEDAAKGGGLVNVHDITIKTEINKRANVKLRDLLGLKSKEEKNAKTEEERKLARLDREIRTEEARAGFSFNRMLSVNSFRNSAAGKKVNQFTSYCDKHKKGILTASASIATLLVFVAGVFNYCTGYEYAYNGATLGIVKSKDDVLRITDLVQGALAEDMNMDVVIDAKDDISFKRVWTLGETDIDTTDDVLKRMTYMRDYKVSSYGVYVDGKKVGALISSGDVQNVLERLKNKYSNNVKSGKGVDVKKSEIEQAVFLEKVEVKECNTRLNHIYSEDEMLSILTTNTLKETIHTSVAGETVEDIALEYGTSEPVLLTDNPNLNAEGEVPAGTAVLIKTTGPRVTVKLVEQVSYDEVIKYETKETKSDEMYEGDEEITVEGKNGSREVTTEVVTVNGVEIGREDLMNKVTKEPVAKEVTVGTKERPPTIGDGKFAWPLKCKFHQTTGFRMRWGRFHKGVDLACPTGNTVYAADGGTVIIARYQPSYGNLVVIDHQNGYTTKYAHNSKILVKEGDKVYEGQPISLVGSTGNSTGPHCHFEIRLNDVPQNPFDYLPPKKGTDGWKE